MACVELTLKNLSLSANSSIVSLPGCIDALPLTTDRLALLSALINSTQSIPLTSLSAP